MEYHLLELRDERAMLSSTVERVSQQNLAAPLHSFPRGYPALAETSVLHALPWTHLAINEGSFLNAYGTYEYFERGPPSIVVSLQTVLTTRKTNRSTNRDPHQLPGMSSCSAHPRLGGVVRGDRRTARRHVRITQPLRAVGVLSGAQRRCDRAVGATRHRNAPHSAQLEQTEGVVADLIHTDVARSGGDSDQGGVGDVLQRRRVCLSCPHLLQHHFVLVERAVVPHLTRLQRQAKRFVARHLHVHHHSSLSQRRRAPKFAPGHPSKLSVTARPRAS